MAKAADFNSVVLTQSPSDQQARQLFVGTKAFLLNADAQH